jgi:hypothetical protein
VVAWLTFAPFGAFLSFFFLGFFSLGTFCFFSFGAFGSLAFLAFFFSASFDRRFSANSAYCCMIE